MKRKISVTTGTRAEYGLLRPLLEEISNSKKLDLKLIVAGMHLSKKYGYSIKEIQKDDFSIVGKIKMIPKNDTNFDMSIALANGILDFSKIFKKIKPDINVILGDRDEALASAMAAYHMNIPNAHIHGGDKTQAGIDEYNRHAITKISNIHFAVSKKSQERILKMGENPRYVFHTGSPGIDDVISKRFTPKQILEQKIGFPITGDEIILLYHPVTTQSGKSQKEIKNIMQAILKLKKNTICISPNSDAGRNAIFDHIQKFSNKKFIQIFNNLPRSDFLGLLNTCGVLVGNSSSGMIEASYFPINVVNIGIRQKDRERGSNVIDVSSDSSNLIYKTIKSSLTRKNNFKIQYIYGKNKPSKKITNILEKITLDQNLIQKQIVY